MNSDENNDSKNVGYHIAEFLADPEGLTDSEIREELAGYDTEKMIDNVKNMVNEALEGDRLAWQKQAKEEQSKSLAQIRESCAKLGEMTREQLINFYYDIKAKKELSLAFRDFDPEKVDDEEIKDMLANLIHLAEIDKSDE